MQHRRPGLASEALVVSCVGELRRSAHPNAPSIWTTYIGQFFQNLPNARLELLWQGYFGAPSPKPTGLLISHGPSDFASFEKQHRTVRCLPKALEMGLSHCGARWRAVALKENLANLCKLFGLLFRNWWLHARSTQTPVFPSPRALEVFALFASKVGQGVMGPDYAHNSRIHR